MTEMTDNQAALYATVSRETAIYRAALDALLADLIRDAAQRERTFTALNDLLAATVAATVTAINSDQAQTDQRATQAFSAALDKMLARAEAFLDGPPELR